MARIIGRLAMNKFVMEHGEAICKATFDDIMARDKKRKSK